MQMRFQLDCCFSTKTQLILVFIICNAAVWSGCALQFTRHVCELLKLSILAAMLSSSFAGRPIRFCSQTLQFSVMNAIIPSLAFVPCCSQKSCKDVAKCEVSHHSILGEDLAGRCMFPLVVCVIFFSLGPWLTVFRVRSRFIAYLPAVKASAATDADCIRHLHRRRPQINIWWRLVVLISDLTEIVYYMGFTC